MPNSVRSVILSQFELVAKEQKRKLTPPIDDLALTNSGLDSLCFAILVVRLEDALGFDPFGASEDAAFPVTVGEFIKFYEVAAR